MAISISDQHPRDAYHNHDRYFELYEELGRKYPESALAHANKQPGTRYWTIMRELHPFARRGDTLVDIGCNDGVYTIPYCEQGGRALGIEISPTLVSRAREKASRLSINCRFLQGDIESKSIAREIREKFDLALFSEVIEHLRNPSQALETIRSLLKPGGSLLLSTPTPLPRSWSKVPLYLFRILFGKRLLEEYFVNTCICPDLQEYGISPFLYRHDGYYPRALVKHVESFGFRLSKSYTIGSPRAILRAVASSLVPQLRSYRSAWENSELAARKLPVLNLLGRTNVLLMLRD